MVKTNFRMEFEQIHWVELPNLFLNKFQCNQVNKKSVGTSFPSKYVTKLILV